MLLGVRMAEKAESRQQQLYLTRASNVGQTQILAAEDEVHNTITSFG